MPARVPSHRPPAWKAEKEGKASGWASDRIRGTRQQRGYGADWQRVRGIVMQRDGGLCQPCLARGRVTAAREVDHMRAKAKGGTDDPDNLQAICVQCHRTKTASESRD